MIRITDENYSAFKKNSRAAIVVSTSSCHNCRDYKPVVNSLEGLMPYINFGEMVLDGGRLIEPKREYRDIANWMLPTTLLFRNGKEVGRIKGACKYPEALKNIENFLIVGSNVYYSNNGNYIQGVVKSIIGDKYILNLNGNSVEAKKGDFKWRSEDKL